MIPFLLAVVLALAVVLLAVLWLGDPGDPTEHKQGNGGRAA